MGMKEDSHLRQTEKNLLSSFAHITRIHAGISISYHSQSTNMHAPIYLYVSSLFPKWSLRLIICRWTKVTETGTISLLHIFDGPFASVLKLYFFCQKVPNGDFILMVHHGCWLPGLILIHHENCFLWEAQTPLVMVYWCSWVICSFLYTTHNSLETSIPPTIILPRIKIVAVKFGTNNYSMLYQQSSLSVN